MAFAEYMLMDDNGPREVYRWNSIHGHIWTRAISIHYIQVEVCFLPEFKHNWL